MNTNTLWFKYRLQQVMDNNPKFTEEQATEFIQHQQSKAGKAGGLKKVPTKGFGFDRELASKAGKKARGTK